MAAPTAAVAGRVITQATTMPRATPQRTAERRRAAPTPITLDQVDSLRTDNVVAGAARGFPDLGIEPTAFETVLPDYLWRFRPSGQYEALKESARNLRT